MKRSPIPENAFFEQAVLDQNLSQRLLELPGFSLELFDFVRGCLTRRVASQSLLGGFQKLLRPTVIEVLVDAFLAAELSYADLSAKPPPEQCGSSPRQNDAGVWLCEYLGQSSRRCPLWGVAPRRATMSQKASPRARG